MNFTQLLNVISNVSQYSWVNANKFKLVSNLQLKFRSSQNLQCGNILGVKEDFHKRRLEFRVMSKPLTKIKKLWTPKEYVN